MTRKHRNVISLVGIIIVLLAMYILDVGWIGNPPPVAIPNEITGQVMPGHFKGGTLYMTASQDQLRNLMILFGVPTLILFTLLGTIGQNENRKDTTSEKK